MVKKIGFLLLISGFLAAAYSTALDTESVNWMMYAVAAFAAITGVFIIKRHERGTAKSATVLSANRAELSDSLEKIVGNLEDMQGAGDAIATDSLRDEIDARLRDGCFHVIRRRVPGNSRGALHAECLRCIH